jgi:hypothetical protein
MGKLHTAGISPELAEWIRQQHVFFVATAPLADGGLVNCSPKGLDSLRVLGPHEVAYPDLTGSGVETIAHLRENGRLVIMFCAFDGAPRIVRLHGTGDVLMPGSPAFELLRPQFPQPMPGLRAIIRARLTRVSDSCGFAVPLMDYRADRDTLVRWAQSKGEAGVQAYREQKNRRSLDGLPGIDGLAEESGC